ncbi:MAG: hypothetical protein ACLT3C_06240 [Peptococcus niger]
MIWQKSLDKPACPPGMALKGRGGGAGQRRWTAAPGDAGGTAKGVKMARRAG